MNKTTKTFTYIIGIVMTIAMVGSLILPMLSGQIAQGDFEQEAATPFPEPTVPAPPDVSAIDFNSRYLHSSGLFTVGAPSGWVAGSSSNTSDELRASLTNSAFRSVVEVRISQNHTGIADLEALSQFLDATWLNHTWSGYSRWDETSRKTTDDGKVQIDFNLSRGRSHTIARQESWLEGGDIYTVRVVMAENAPRELKFILHGVADGIERLPIYADAPFGWDAYFDNLDKHILRYPSDWEVTDAAPGLPATILGDDLTLAVATFDVAIDNEEEAGDWIEDQRSGIEARSVEAVDVGGAPGYKVSYRYTTLDGEVESGLLMMLHGTDNRLHVANLRAADLNENLLSADHAAYPWLEVIDTFRLTPELEIDLQ
ncbi:MAG: hypothetical protein OXG78_11415 [Chloroflexi bacterium]|nr:hypothetical protein [Chloroflexota bacterium]